MRNYALRLIAYEAQQNQSSETDHPAALGVCEKLREPLASLAGVNGFRSLLSRALALAGNEVHWLRAVHIKGDGSLAFPAETAELDQKKISDGEPSTGGGYAAAAHRFRWNSWKRKGVCS